LVKSQKFVTNKVVTRCKALGDRRFPEKILEHLGCAPAGAAKGRCGHALLVDLERDYQYLDRGLW
jgi:hypothetical protein